MNIKYNLYLYIYIVITNIKKYKWKSFILITNQQQKRLKMSKKTMQYNKAFVSIFYLHHFATLFYSIHNTIIQKKNGWRSFHFSTSSYLVFCIEYTKKSSFILVNEGYGFGYDTQKICVLWGLVTSTICRYSIEGLRPTRSTWELYERHYTAIFTHFMLKIYTILSHIWRCTFFV